MPPSKKVATAPPRGQKSLTSFFGAAMSSKTGKALPPRKVQNTLEKAFVSQSSKSKKAPSESKLAPRATEDGPGALSSSGAARCPRDGEKESLVISSEDDCTDTKPTKPRKENTEVSEKDAKMEVKKAGESISPAAKKGARSQDANFNTNAANAVDKVKTTTKLEIKETMNGADHEDSQSDDLMDTDDEETETEQNKRPVRTKSTAKKSSPASRKRAILDDNDDDDDDEAEDDEGDEEYNDENVEDDDETVDLEEEKAGVTETSIGGDDIMDSNEDEDSIMVNDLKSKINGKEKKEKKSQSSLKAKKQKTLSSSKGTIAVTKKPASNMSKSEVTARGMKSDADLHVLMKENADSWKSDQPTSYAGLCDAFVAIEATSGRLEIQERLTELFRMVLLREGGGDNMGEEKETDDKAQKKPSKNSPDSSRGDMYELIYLASNSVAPAYECVELGVGDSVLIKAIGEASGTNAVMIKKKYATEGDLGSVAQTSKGKQKTLVGFGRMAGPKLLAAKEVLSVFRQIANTSGNHSRMWKADKIKGLLVRARGPEPKYLIRGLQGKLRIGLAQTTVLASLAHAVALTRPKGVAPLSSDRLTEIRELDGEEGAYPDFARKLCEKELPLDARLEAAANVVKKAYSEVPSFDSLLDALLVVPLQEIHKACTLTPGIPVVPMLAKPTKSVLEVLKRLNGMRFTCEYKYDGERAQVHMTPDGVTKVFSRSLLNTSEKFPEVPLYVKESCKGTNVSSFVLDTEVVGFNRETKQFVPFQVLSTRKKTEESAETAKVQVIVQAFDLMFLNGVSLLDRTLGERRELLKKNFIPIDGKFQYATSLDHTENGDTTVIEEFLDNAVKGQCEGLMVKTLDQNAAYEPSRRSLNWLKLKKDYLEGLGDSVDLVPLGAYHGKGKRTGVYGAYLLACYDQDTEQFQSVCKIGTGFSDEDLKELAASLKDHVIPAKSSQYNVADILECNVWFDAVHVWEVKAADLSKSSTHKGALDKTGESGRGIGLRFPRFERVRPDKKPEDATTSDQILDMYYAQDSVVDGGDGGGDDDGI